MNVTREIVKDLLPLYVSGESSPDTNRLVEAFLREDPELSRLAAALREDALAPLRTAPVAAGAGRDALAQTKSLLRRRTWFLAMALFLTGLPFSFVFSGDGLTFLLIRDAPALGTASLAAGLALWIAYGVTAWRLRVSGL